MTISRGVILLLFLAGSVSSQTFRVKNGAWPWHDRVDRWQLTDVPEELAADDEIPQQSCGSRGLEFPEGLKAAVVAMSPSDARRLLRELKLPLRQTDLRVTIRSADGKAKLPYPVFVYPTPPKVLDTKGNARAGLLLLRLSDHGIQSRPCETETAMVTPTKPPAQPTRFHLYLLVGQSNMAGRGKVEAMDLATNPSVLSLNREEHWVVALDPLHTDKPRIAGVGLGTTFGKVMADATPDAVIGLIPCAVGGTTISQWQKGAPPVGQWGKLYDNAIQRTRIAQRDGVLKGILWHQGEGDSSTNRIAAYREKLTRLVTDFRADLSAPDVPFVAGMLGVWDPKRHASRQAFNENLARLPEWFPKAAVVSAKGLPHKGDGTHFASKGLRELGRRYADGFKEARNR